MELGLILAGLTIATLAMAIGIGGGIMWTPLLLLVYGASAQEAVTTSLVIQVVGMGSGTWSYHRAGLTEVKLSLTLFAAALPGVIIGSYIMVNLPPDMVRMALGMMALTVALLFVAANEGKAGIQSYQYQLKKVTPILPLPAVLGFAMGCLSVGVSEWMLPVLKAKLHLRMNQAVATVVPTMFLLALVASVCHGFLAQSMRWDLIIWASAGTLIGGQIGPHLAQKVNEKMLQEAFIYLMTLIGIHLIFNAL